MRAHVFLNLNISFARATNLRKIELRDLEALKKQEYNKRFDFTIKFILIIIFTTIPVYFVTFYGWVLFIFWILEKGYLDFMKARAQVARVQEKWST